MRSFLLTIILPLTVLCLTREELVEHLKGKQETRSTFDSRIPRIIRPIGYVAGEPIWPRVLERVKSEAELFFDDDFFLYEVNPVRDAAGLIRKIDSEDNFNKVVEFLEKYS